MNLFEKDYLASVEWFLEKGEEALQMLEESSYGGGFAVRLWKKA